MLAGAQRLVRQGWAFALLLHELRGVRNKVRFVGYVMGGRHVADNGRNRELLLDFKHAKLSCGRGAGELYSYVEIFLDDDYRISSIALDEKTNVILDVGANIGVFSLAAAKRFTGAVIYAFEPDAMSYRRLTRNIELNRAASVTPMNLAVWSSSGAIAFSDSGATTARHAIDDGGQRVETISLDDFCLQTGIGQIGLLKIDVEGAELEVLRGAVRTLEVTEWLVLECHSAALASEVEAVLNAHDFRKVSERRVPDGGGVLRFKSEKIRP